MIIDENILYKLYREQGYYKGVDFKVIQDEITSSDFEDGGSDHEIVIQDLSTSKFYKGYYTDWDIDFNFEYKNGEVMRCDFDNDLNEVFPEQITITVYR